MQKKPLRIIVSILILLIVSLIFLYFFINKENKEILQSTNEDEVLTSFFDKLKVADQEDVKQNEKYLKRAEDSELIIATKSAIEADACDILLDESLKQDCYTLIDVERSIRTLDLAECRQYEGDWKDMCLFFISTTKKEKWEDCQEIEDEKIHDWCVKSLAIELNDNKVCYRAFAGVESCFDTTKALNNGWGGDINECADIVKTEYFLLCVNTSEDPCEDLVDEYLVKRCKCVRNYALIMTKGEKVDCAALPLDRFRKTCEIYFDNNKVHVDSDGDGINNGLELFVDTDPFTFEDEAETMAWYELRWGEVMDNAYYQTLNKVQPLITDTDSDGLMDYEETEIYKTDPENRDSDGDGYLDGDEVKSGFDPLGEGDL